MGSEREYRTASDRPRSDQPLPVPSTVLVGTRVFLAEDEPMLSWALEEVLTDLGCRVVGTATRVTEALAFVTNHAFDVAILDGKLTDGTIDPVVDVLLARGTPVIIATGVTSSECAERFGNVVSIQKPYKDTDVGQALLRALARAG